MPIRVLVVDDALVARRVVCRALDAEEDLQVAGAAWDAETALTKARELEPDVVVLDLELPGTSGLETLRMLRALDDTLPVVIFSHLAVPGSDVADRVMAAGASGVVVKPTGATGVGMTLDHVGHRLAPMLRKVARRRPVVPPPAVVAQRQPAVPPSVVVVGSSTGGPQALTDLFDSLTGPLSLPVLVAQHLGASFTSLLVDRLARSSGLHVTIAEDGVEAVPGSVYVAPGDRHLRLERWHDGLRLRLDDGVAVNSCRPSVDVLFRSAAEACGGAVLGVVLTGMGRDGMEGSRAIRTAGGSVVVQDEASSVVWGMPRAVAEAGLADEIVPLVEMAAAIERRMAARV